MIEQLNERFGKHERIHFDTGEGAMTRARLTSSEGHVAELYLHGAHVTSWRAPDLGELLFTSTRAIYKQGTAIRGGIPLIFPQFGPGPLPSHGFARNSLWEVEAAAESAGHPSLTLKLSSSDQSRSVWPHDFEARLTVLLDTALTLTLEVRSARSIAPFQVALHTYFRVGAIGETIVRGLGGLRYLDNLRGKAEGHEARTDISIDREIDRVYLSAPDRLFIDDTKNRRRFTIEKHNLPDAVLWNPWIEKTAGLKDMAPEEYREMVCVEAGAIGAPISLENGGVFRCVQRICADRM